MANETETTKGTASATPRERIAAVRTRVLPALKNVVKLPRAIVLFVVNILKGLVNFSTSAVQELRQVTWLSRKDTVKFSTYVILFVVLGAVVIALVDLAFFRIFVVITS